MVWKEQPGTSLGNYGADDIAELNEELAAQREWEQHFLLRAHLTIGDRVEESLVRSILGLRGKCACSLAEASSTDDLSSARRKVDMSRTLIVDLMANIDELMRYRVQFRPKIVLRQDILVGRAEKVRALTSPPEGTPEARLVELIDEIEAIAIGASERLEARSCKLEQAWRDHSRSSEPNIRRYARVAEKEMAGWIELSTHARAVASLVMRSWAKSTREYLKLAIVTRAAAPRPTKVGPPLVDVKWNTRGEVH